MNLSAAEREVIITRTMAEDEWSVYVSDPVNLKFWAKLTARCGGVAHDRPGGAKSFRIPCSLLRFSVKKKMNLTDDQRQQRRESIAKARSNR